MGSKTKFPNLETLNIGLGQPKDIKFRIHSPSRGPGKFKMPGRKELIVRARKITDAHQAVRSRFFLYKEEQGASE